MKFRIKILSMTFNSYKSKKDSIYLILLRLNLRVIFIHSLSSMRYTLINAITVARTLLLLGQKKILIDFWQLTPILQWKFILYECSFRHIRYKTDIISFFDKTLQIFRLTSKKVLIWSSKSVQYPLLNVF